MSMPSVEIMTHSQADLTACHESLRGGSRSFFAASFLLPRCIGEPASALYAFCRLSDDAVDLAGDSHVALEQLRDRLDRAYSGQPLPVPADRAFAAVVKRYAVPRALPDALLDGFEWDANGRRYQDLSGLYAYSARVAGSVGAMMAVLMRVRSPELLARACDLGVAMQLTNIARDVGEDARAGRLYLPTDWLWEAGIDPDAWLAQPVFSPALGTVIQRLLSAADELYQRAATGIAGLPLQCRPGMFAARYLYAEIGRELERQGLNSVARRAVVPMYRKAVMLSRALSATPVPLRPVADPPLAETDFLVQAVVNTPAPEFLPSIGPLGRIEERLVGVIDLFERLERRQQQFVDFQASTQRRMSRSIAN
jgi:phytoene synthase